MHTFNYVYTGEEILQALGNIDNFLDLLPSSDRNAIIEPLCTEKLPLTHSRLKQFVSSEFELGELGVLPGDRIALVLPNGPELALLLIAVISRWCAAPINPSNTWEEIRGELEGTKVCIDLYFA